MSNRGAALAEAIVPFAPKSNARAETGDPLDRAGQTILSALDRAAGAAEEKYRQAVETTHKVSAQLRAAEDQIRELEGKARYQENRADRAIPTSGATPPNRIQTPGVLEPKAVA